MQAGVGGLLRDKSRRSRIPPLGPEIAERVVVLTFGDPPGERTHWTASGDRHQRQFGAALSTDPKFAEKLRDIAVDTVGRLEKPAL
ncbi:MAG: hypothetical protein JO283_14560 [Bradyrhizobium sp.]|nr:hypothetical protein [Bradyrhizobium sp.]